MFYIWVLCLGVLYLERNGLVTKMVWYSKVKSPYLRTCLRMGKMVGYFPDNLWEIRFSQKVVSTFQHSCWAGNLSRNQGCQSVIGPLGHLILPRPQTLTLILIGHLDRDREAFPYQSLCWLPTCSLWDLSSLTLALASFLALWLLFVLDPWLFLAGCDSLPWISVLHAAFGRSLCPSSSSTDLDAGHLASTLSRPALVPWDTVEELSRDDRTEWTVYRSPSV